MIEKHKFYYEVSTAWCCLGQRVDTDECDTVTVEAKTRYMDTLRKYGK